MVYWRDDEDSDKSWHDVAQICLNGHIINSSTKRSPQFNKKFCDRCGKAAITQCEQCSNPIQGHYHSPGLISVSEIFTPAFCQNCGAAYPWTTVRLEAARELALELDGLNDTDKETLSQSIDDLIKDTPSTPVAATRFKNLLAKAGKEGASALRDILVDIASETAKKIIWPA